MMKTLLRKSLAALTGIALFTGSYGFNTEQNRALWTTMASGGANNMGVIYSVNPDGSNGTAIITFNGSNGANPSGNMVQGPDNWLYGTTLAGGNNNCGVLFKFDPNNNSGQIQVLHSFTPADGRSPRSLLLASNGKIYGTTQSGGTHNTTSAPEGAGTLYEFDPTTANSFTKLYDFDNLTGEVPQALIQGADGKIYGMCRQGGVTNNGVIFSYQAGTGFTKLYDLNETDGKLPTNCKLLQAVNGKLYGLATWGGNGNMGTLFSYDVQSNAFAKLHDFGGANGAFPTGVLMQAGNGLLYGITSYGGNYGLGTLFSYNTSMNVFEVLHNFNGTLGAVPVAGVIQGSDGSLYGNTSEGGANSTGVIYNYNLGDNIYTVVENCDAPSTGGKPASNILELQPVTTGIKDIQALTIAMYPNPATSTLFIGDRNVMPQYVAITNVSGQKVFEARNTNTVDVSQLAAGVYIVEVKTEAGTAHGKLNKQ